MRFTSSTALVALSSYAVLTSALPYWSQKAVDQSFADSLEKRKVPYSVVPVDGGPQSSAAPDIITEETTKTVTKPASTLPPTTLPPTTQTVVSTVIVTESDVETTVIVTSTVVIATKCPLCPSDAADPPPSSTTPAVAPVQVTNTAYSQATVATAVSVPGRDIAVTAAQPTSTQTYDNGMYHTTWSHWNSTTYAPAPTAASRCSSDTPSVPTTTDASVYLIDDEDYENDEATWPSTTLQRRNKEERKPTPTSDLPPPNLPKLPKTVSEDPNPSGIPEIPTIDLTKFHVTPTES
jgi:hypothetical protein